MSLPYEVASHVKQLPFRPLLLLDAANARGVDMSFPSPSPKTIPFVIISDHKCQWIVPCVQSTGICVVADNGMFAERT